MTEFTKDEIKLCPFCGYVCYCDLDDTWDLPIPDDCPHVCREDDLESDDSVFTEEGGKNAK